ncbi:MAG: SAM-dependent methyltransferase, partial [Pseudomonas sp.]|nr:SAM-dependent methyltransferase [Pseudomonas sp.]
MGRPTWQPGSTRRMSAMSEPILTSGDLLARFRALDSFLLQHQALWRPRPFHHLQPPWETELPELAIWLRGRSLEQAEASDNSPFAL